MKSIALTQLFEDGITQDIGQVTEGDRKALKELKRLGGCTRPRHKHGG